jgi:Domain of unknown function (DUF3127)
MELTGKILEIQSEKVISAKFRKRSMILETTEDRFPQTFEVEFTQDRGELLDKCSVGQQVLISINLEGRKWTPPSGGDARYFTSIRGWRIQAADAGSGYEGPAPGGPGPASSNNDDDIPF